MPTVFPVRFALCLSIAVLLAACSPTGPGPEAPGALAGLTAAGAHGIVTLDWEHDGERTSGYRVIRRLASSQTETLVEVGADERSYRDHHAEVGLSYDYTVAPLDADGRAAPGGARSASVTVEPGLTMTTGTYAWTGGGQPTTAFGFFFYLPRSAWPMESVPYTLSGPAGWNDDQPWTGTFHRWQIEGGFLWFTVPTTPAVPGTYRIEVETVGEALVATSDLEEVDEVVRLSGLELLSADADEVSVGWDVHPSAASYVVTLFAGVPGDADTVLSRRVTATSVTLDGLDLAEGTYFVAVSTYPFDGLQPGRSLPPERFDVAEAATPVFTIPAE